MANKPKSKKLQFKYPVRNESAHAIHMDWATALKIQLVQLSNKIKDFIGQIYCGIFQIHAKGPKKDIQRFPKFYTSLLYTKLRAI